MVARNVGFGSSVALVLLAATPLVGLYLHYVAGLPGSLAAYVLPGLLAGVALPLVNAFHSWLRGLLMAARATSVIYWGNGLNLCVMAAMVWGGVALQAHGVVTAVLALIVSLAAEILYLRRQTARAIEQVSRRARAIVAHRVGGKADGRR